MENENKTVSTKKHMKKPVKVALIVTSSALLAGGVAATGLVLWQKGVFDSVKFKEDNGIAVITDVARPDRNGNVVVPSEIKGKPVTTIESNAFSNNSKIVNVELPDTIVTIGSRAFANCKNLKTLIIPDSIKEIAEDAFIGCDNLTIKTGVSYRTWKEVYNGSLSDMNVECSEYDIYIYGSVYTTAAFGEKVNIYAKDITGYTFSNWLLRAGATNERDEYSGNSLSFTYKYHSQLSIGTNYTANTYSISLYNEEYGSKIKTLEVTYDSYPSTVEVPVKKGYTFNGYYIDGYDPLFNENGVPYNVYYYPYDVSAYADWSANTYRASFDTRGGSNVSSTTVKYDTTFKMPTPTRTGYSFGGWKYKGQSVSNSFTWKYDENVEFTATWIANNYRVTLDVNGGTVNASSINTIYDNKYKLPTPTRTGYTFLGWSFDGGDTYVDIRGVWKYTNITYLVACWSANDYFVTFNLNGGSGVYNDYYTYDSSYTLPTPTRTGYTFNGWYENSYFTGDSFEESGIWEVPNDVTLYAKWTANNYLVTFHTNNGTLPSGYENDEMVVTYDSTYVIPIPTRTGYTFNGWYTNSSLTTSYSKTTYWTRPNDLDLYAKWTANTYVVSYYSNGGTSYSNTTMTYDSSYTLPTPTKTGYSFGGWYENSTFTGEPFEISGIWNETRNVSLYAKWTAKDYSIFLVVNNGTLPSGYQTTIPVTYDSTYYVPTPTRTGYTFGGWYTNSSLTTSFSKTTYWTRTSDLTLYAKWTAISYSVTFVSNGGTSYSSRTIAYDSSYTLPTPTKTGYNFLGWYLDSDLTEPILSTGIWNYASNKTVYAKWSVGQYLIELNTNEGILPDDASSGILITYGSSYTLPTPTKAGYTFAGWYTSSSFSGTALPLEGTWTMEGNKILYAKWIANTYSLTLHLDGGTYASSTSDIHLTATYGEAYSLPTPTKAGYKFAGWVNEDEESFASNGTWYSLSNVELTATWIEVANSIVTFDSNGGTVCESQSIVYGSTYTLPTPTKTGYRFDGWFNGDELVPQTGIWAIEGNVELTAHWTSLIPTISYSFPDSYKFVYNSSSGYYVSNNKRYDNTFAYAKVTIDSEVSYNLQVQFISYGESNYDYEVISNLDVELSHSNKVDTSGVKSSKTSSSAVKTLDYGTVSSGTHFITLKYRKDGSQSSGNDTLQFKIIVTPIY